MISRGRAYTPSTAISPGPGVRTASRNTEASGTKCSSLLLRARSRTGLNGNREITCWCGMPRSTVTKQSQWPTSARSSGPSLNSLDPNTPLTVLTSNPGSQSPKRAGMHASRAIRAPQVTGFRRQEREHHAPDVPVRARPRHGPG